MGDTGPFVGNAKSIKTTWNLVGVVGKVFTGEPLVEIDNVFGADVLLSGALCKGP